MCRRGVTAVAVFGFDMLGDALRDLLDPRLKGG
jgi:ABC-type dipeptide/oligopeptide/nickel transport system permease subunit